MIKNFFVKTQVVKNKDKGLTNYINYLKSKEHKNHKDKTQKILEIMDKDFIFNTKKNILTKELENKLNKKGGSSFQSYRQSFCLSFPTNVNQNILKDEKLKEISLNIIKEIFKKMEIPLKNEYLQQLFCNIHFNENIHINIVLQKVISGKSYDFSKKQILNHPVCFLMCRSLLFSVYNFFLNLVKTKFDLECENLGILKRDYKPKTQNNSKTLQQYKMSQEGKKIYLEMELELIKLKQMKDEVINTKIDNIEIKKEFYNSVNPFITRGLEERKKLNKTINLEQIKQQLKEVVPTIQQQHKKIIEYNYSMSM